MIIQNIDELPRLSNDIRIEKIEKDNYIIHQTALDRRIKVNTSVMYVMDELKRDQVKTWDELSLKLNLELNQNICIDNLKDLIFKELVPLGIIESEDYHQKEKPASYLSLKVALFSTTQVSFFSGFFVQLFSPKFFYVSGVSMILFLLLLYFKNFSISQALKVSNPENLTVTSVLILISILIHELGHATACRKFGAKHGGIGFGFYIFSPVCYADVSDVWKLPSRERIIVDLAGIYLELLLATFFGIIYLIMGNPISMLLISFTLISLIANLNPFLRYDGYWVLSDILQISNLRSKSLSAFKDFFKNPLSNSILSTKLNLFLFVYGFLSISFFVIFLFYLVFNNPNSILYFPLNLFDFFKKIIIQHELVKFEWLKFELKKLGVPFFFYFVVFRMILKRSFRISSLFKL